MAELRTLHDAEHSILESIPSVATQATSTRLRHLLAERYQQTRTHLEALDVLFEQRGLPSASSSSEGIEGLLKDNRRLMAAMERGPVLDAAIVSTVQQVDRYEVALCSCARAHATAVGDAATERLLQHTIDDTRSLDQRLGGLAKIGAPEASKVTPRTADTAGPGATRTQADQEDAPGTEPNVRARDVEQPKTTTPRIERYQER
jgi:ferritin-like metal-binding protein YciE